MKNAYGVTFTPGTRFMINSAAAMAFELPTSFGLPTGEFFHKEKMRSPT